MYLIRVKKARQTSNFFFRAFRLPTPDSRLPTPDSRLPTPDSRLLTPDSLKPMSRSRFLADTKTPTVNHQYQR
ncbi:hypothetical protein [Moorena sp. SIO4G3]|uniref:hypothetical protein n=1 Tax=Moorena sp. SIO4G3 TaxID=2607821 RepID=UPI00142A5095|nr:hypothetical protein [Moorena sp. SIO4G3]NEO76902.1 hypothetical protein [Moorena sp. SIO4G3]